MEVKNALGIAGLGILGCSIALRYRRLYPTAQVLGLDTSATHLAVARERGAITGVAETVQEIAACVDVLVLATPVNGILELLQTLSGMHGVKSRPSLVLDVASVKVLVAEAGVTVPHFVATHPMAGSEAHGPGAARADLFEGRPWAYVPSDDAAAIAKARTFIELLGAHAVAISAAEHDALVARTSHLPQTLSTVLALCALRKPLHGLYGQGLLDMLRLARSPDSVWNDIYVANADAIAAELHAYAEALQQFAAAVQARDRAAISGVFHEANHRADNIV